jgi:hypothetical protein
MGGDAVTAPGRAAPRHVRDRRRRASTVDFAAHRGDSTPDELDLDLDEETTPAPA